MNTLTLQHIDETPNSTVSGLLLNGVHLAYIIEDGFREVKVKGETRIYAGTYELFPRKSGGFFERYSKRFNHDFVIGFKEVPQFTYILIHVGNDVLDSSGCLLACTDYHMGEDGNYEGTESAKAYKSLHAIVKELFNDGKVFIEIDRGIKPDVPVVVVPDDPVTVGEPADEPPNNNGCLVRPIVIIALICFGAAIASLP